MDDGYLIQPSFPSTHPVWGGTTFDRYSRRPQVISIHPPRVGWDWAGMLDGLAPGEFQSTHPVWGGTRARGRQKLRRVFQSTHPVWGGTSCQSPAGVGKRISIHPPRVGWDQVSALCCGDGGHFNPPTPCGVGLDGLKSGGGDGIFQSTHPVWGGTPWTRPWRPGERFQSTHPVWGGTTMQSEQETMSIISIHPPRVGWDSKSSQNRP